MGEFSKKLDSTKNLFKKNKLKHIIGLIIHSNTTPYQIALGLAIGVFLSIIPTFGIGMILALLLAWKFKLNLISTYLGTLVVNPLNGSFIYFLDYKIGALILGDNSNFFQPITLQHIKDISLQMFLGGFILSAIVSIILYFFTYMLITGSRKARDRSTSS